MTRHDRVRHGPYAWLEHPSEWGLLLLSAGSVAVLGSWPAAGVWTTVLLPSVLFRMRAETLPIW